MPDGSSKFAIQIRIANDILFDTVTFSKQISRPQNLETIFEIAADISEVLNIWCLQLSRHHFY